jgi:hypothetical protein
MLILMERTIEMGCVVYSTSVSERNSQLQSFVDAVERLRVIANQHHAPRSEDLRGPLPRHSPHAQCKNGCHRHNGTHWNQQMANSVHQNHIQRDWATVQT